MSTYAYVCVECACGAAAAMGDGRWAKRAIEVFGRARVGRASSQPRVAGSGICMQRMEDVGLGLGGMQALEREPMFR